MLFFLGKDGYELFKNCKRIVDNENAVMLQNIVTEFFSISSKA